MGGRRPAQQVIARVSICAVLAFGAVSACGTHTSRSRGIYHTVRAGENLYRIGKAYGVPHGRLAQVNRLRDPSRIFPGQRLFVPGADRTLPVDVIAPRDRAVAVGPDDGPLPVSERPFAWPIENGTVSSAFGPRGLGFHDGIDIAAAPGTPVLAAADGAVAYAAELRGYGRVIIVRHDDGYATVYAHNRENRVREGQRVRRGEVIAKVGASGRASGPNLHFEVRRDNTARNPLFYLPPLAGARQTAAR